MPSAAPTHDLADAELVALCAAGDERAWDALVERHSPLVYTIARRAGLDQAAAEDATQATFLALFRELGGMRDGQSVSKWLIVVARRQALRERHRQLRAGAPTDDATLPDASIQHGEASETTERWECRAAVREAVRTLGGRCRDLLTILFLEPTQPDYDLIAERLDMPRGSIGPTRARCLSKLLAHMQREFPHAIAEHAPAEVSPARAPSTSPGRTA